MSDIPKYTEEDRMRDLEEDYRIAGKDGLKEWQAAIRLANAYINRCRELLEERENWRL